MKSVASLKILHTVALSTHSSITLDAEVGRACGALNNAVLFSAGFDLKSPVARPETIRVRDHAVECFAGELHVAHIPLI